ncbi:hypothetical protein ABZT12_27560, partial [Streptomyces sp. NPDC005423]
SVGYLLEALFNPYPLAAGVLGNRWHTQSLEGPRSPPAETRITWGFHAEHRTRRFNYCLAKNNWAPNSRDAAEIISEPNRRFLRRAYDRPVPVRRSTVPPHRDERRISRRRR